MIQYLDLKEQNQPFSKEIEQYIKDFLKGGRYILGPVLEEFEKSFAKFCGSKYCIGTGNGLDAIRLILEAYKISGKLNIGDEVVVCGHNYIATILAVKQARLKPVFVDAEEIFYNYNLNFLEQRMQHAKAMIVTHMYGQVAPMTALKTIAEAYNVIVIEDAAQAHGAVYKGTKVGNLTEAAAFSFYPSKNLGALGDGGAITTKDSELANILIKLRNYGTSSKYVNDYIGFNSRLDPLQAGILSIKLKKLDKHNEIRKLIAERYFNEIKNSKVKLPVQNDEGTNVFHIFPVRVKKRSLFLEYLTQNQIGFLIHYPIPPHKQKALSEFQKLSLPITEQLAEELVSIPLNPMLKSFQIDRIIEVLNGYE